MKTINAFALGLFSLFTGCHLTQDIFERGDNYEITPPRLRHVTIKYPGVAEFTIIQNIETSKEATFQTVTNSIIAKRLSYTQVSEFECLIRFYKDDLFVFENLDLLVKKAFSDSLHTFDLGSSSKILLDEQNVEIKILEAGIETPRQSKFRGYYVGNYSLMKSGSLVALGAAEGYVDFEGKFKIETKGTTDIRFFSGNGIENTDGGKMIFNSELTKIDSSVVAILKDTLTYSEASKSLSGNFSLSSAHFDSLIINLSKQ